MALATLSIDIEARLAKLEEGMTKATRVAERSADAIQKRYEAVGATFQKLGRQLAGAFSFEVLRRFAMQTVDGLDALDDLAEATGASVENLSALEDVALRTGTSFESMAATVVKFNKDLIAATPGSEMANTLRAIGLDAERLKQIDPAEALRQAAVAVEKYANSGNKGRIYTVLFNRSVQEAGPFMTELAKKTELVGTVSAEAAAEAEKFNNQIRAITKNATDAARQLAGPLLKALNDIIEAGKKGGFSAAVGQFLGFDEITRLAAGVRAAEKEVTDAQARLERASKAHKAPSFLEALVPEENRRKAFEQAEAAAQAAADRLAQRMAEINAASAAKWEEETKPPEKKDKAPKIPEATKATQLTESERALKAYVDQLDRQRTKLQDLTAEQEALNFLQELGTTGQIPQVRELVLGLAAQADQLADNAAMKKLDADALADSARSLSSYIEQLERQRTTLKDLSHEQEAFNFLEKLGTAGQITQIRELVLGLAAEADQLEENAALKRLNADAQDEMNKKADLFGEQAARNIQNAIGDALAGVEVKWGELLRRMAAEAAAAQIGRHLFGVDNKGGVLDPLLKAIGFRAGGGPVSPGMPYVVGEKGPELFVPRQAGTVIANGRQQASVVINDNRTVNVGDIATASQVAAAIAASNAQLQSTILRSKSRGGVYA